MSRTPTVPDLPEIPTGSTLSQVIDWLQKLRTQNLAREPVSVGDALQKFVTVGDLVGNKLLKYSGGVVGLGSAAGGTTIIGGGGGGGGGDPYVPDLTPPDPITGLAVTGLLADFFVEFNAPTYTQGHGNGYTAIYAANWAGTPNALPTFADAVEVYQVTGAATIAIIPAQPGQTTCFWAAAVTVDGVSQIPTSGPTGGLHGVHDETGQDVSSLLAALNGKITRSQLYTDIGTPIDLITAPSTTPGSVNYRIATSAANLTSAYEAADGVTYANGQTYVQGYAYSKSTVDGAITSQYNALTAAYTAQSANLAPNPGFIPANASWDGSLLARTAAGVPANAPSGYVNQWSGRDCLAGSLISVTPGEILDCSVWVASNSATTHSCGLLSYARDAAGNIGFPPLAIIGVGVTGWAQATGTLIVPAGIVSIQPVLWIEQAATGGSDTVCYAQPTIIRRGGVTAGALTAAHADVVSYTYAKATIDGAFSSQFTTLTANYGSADSATLAAAQAYTYAKSDIDGAIASSSSTLTASLSTLSLVARGNAVVKGNTIAKVGGVSAWDSDVYSTNSYTGGAFASGVVTSTTSAHFMFGLNSDPTTDENYTSLDYAWYVDSGTGTYAIFESGGAVLSGIPASAGDVLSVAYDGVNVVYQQNGVARRTVAVSGGLTLFFDSSLYDPGGPLSHVQFGPLSGIGGVSAAIQTEATVRASADGTLFAQNTVKEDINGYVSGYGLASTSSGAAPTSSFIIRADSFAVGSPSGPGIAPVVPFTVVTTPTTINGVAVPVGIYADGAYFLNGTITNAKIGNLAVTDAKIVSLSVGKLTAGSIAVGEYIQSTGYVAGSAGWAILGNGNAEFSNVTVRGAIYANGSSTFAGALVAATGTFGAVTIAAGGSIRSGQTAYNTGTGFWWGFDSSIPKFSIGSSTGARLTWDGTNLTIVNANVTTPALTLSAYSASVPGGNLSVHVANGGGSFGSRSVSVSGGTAPYSYLWQATNVSYDAYPTTVSLVMSNSTTATLTLAGKGTNNEIYATMVCTVTDATGRTTSTSFELDGSIGTPP